MSVKHVAVTDSARASPRTVLVVTNVAPLDVGYRKGLFGGEAGGAEGAGLKEGEEGERDANEREE